MYANTLIALFAGAAFAMAHETSGESSGVSNTCSAGNVVACCDTTDANGILANVLGGSCDIPNLLSISNNCPAGNTFCCPTNQDGSIDVDLECTPISA